MGNHLAVYNRKIFAVDYVQMMLDGSKTVDIKLANRRIAPYGYIKPGDFMYIKESSGPVVGRVMIPQVHYYELEPGSPELLDILLVIQERVGLRDEEHAHRMFENNSYRKYATVFELADPIELPNPVRIEKNNMFTWVPDYHVPLELRMAFGIGDEVYGEFDEPTDEEGSASDNNNQFKLR